MKARVILGIAVGLLVAVATTAEAQLRQGSPAQQLPTTQPRRPVAAQQRAPQARQPAAQPPRAPFVLTPQQRADVDRLLTAWEGNNERIKTFRCKFTRWKFNLVFQPDGKAGAVDDGELKYARPDKGMYRVVGEHPEHWVCDGDAIFEFDYTKKQLTEHRLPPELRGKAITEGPLPFLFGAKADSLSQRYFLRIITPPGVQEQIWLEAWPRYQRDAANFKRAELILASKDMLPKGLRIFMHNDKEWTTHGFSGIVINDPLNFLQPDFSRPRTPRGWTKVTEGQAAGSSRQASQQQAGGSRR